MIGVWTWLACLVGKDRRCWMFRSEIKLRFQKERRFDGMLRPIRGQVQVR